MTVKEYAHMRRRRAIGTKQPLHREVSDGGVAKLTRNPIHGIRERRSTLSSMLTTLVALVVTATIAVPLANADVLPPQPPRAPRPAWDQEAPPEPDPPPERPIERILLAGLGLGVLALALTAARRRMRPVRPGTVIAPRGVQNTVPTVETP